MTADRPTSPDPWIEWMQRGEFGRAWEVSDAALAARRGVPCWHWPRHFQYVWDGAPLAGKRVLVRCYHGLGDTIQFARFLAPLRAIAREVTVWAQPALIPLLERVAGVDRLTPLHDGVPEVEFDADVEIMELGHVFRVTLEMLPGPAPYLFAEPAEWVRARMKPGELAVGVVWRAGDWDARRSIAPELLAPWTSVRGVRWFALQQHPEPESPFRSEGRVTPVEKLAEAIRAMDLVITVDSLAAHLAGALGVRTWTLLPQEADWRWMRERDNSPWYPTMRLWRQGAAGDWRPVIARVAAELANEAVDASGTVHAGRVQSVSPAR